MRLLWTILPILEPRTFMPSRNMILRAFVALATLVVSFHPVQLMAAAPASAGEERPVKTVRFVIVEQGIEEDWIDHFREATREKIHADIADAGFEVTEDVTADATVRLSLKVDNADDFIYHFEIEITVGDQHTVLDDAKCEDCLTDKLVLVAEQQAPRIIDALKVARVQPNSTNVAIPDGPTNGGEKVKPLGPLGGVGIGVAVLGVGATIAGAVELSKGKVFDPDTVDQRYPAFVDHTPAGQALLGVGVASMAIGVALLVTDVTIRAKKRRKQESGTHAFFPLAGDHVVGLGLIQRF